MNHMTKKQKAEEIIRQGGSCKDIMCGYDSKHECPAYKECASGNRSRQQSKEACEQFLYSITKKAKTKRSLLDDFAISVIPAIVSRRPYITDKNTTIETLKKIIDAEVVGAYLFAESMMREREKHNVKMTIRKSK